MGRLGHNTPADLRQVIDRGTRDLDLMARLETLHSKGVEGLAGGLRHSTYDTEFMEVFRASGLGTVGDDPEVVARRIRESNIRKALIASLDRYSVFIYTGDPDRCTWALKVASKADPDQSSWRLRARDLNVIKSQAVQKISSRRCREMTPP